jgi:hypothetical protein
MHVPGSKRECRQVEFGFVGGIHDGSIRVADTDGVVRNAFVDDMRRDRTEVRRAAAVGYGVSIGGYVGGGTYRTNWSG